MKEFYGHIRVDAETFRYSAECPVCGKKQYAGKLPFICRNMRTFERCCSGRANKLSQSVYNHTTANAIRNLSMRFNQCRHCCRWVCDDCYDITDDLGACVDCATKNN